MDRDDAYLLDILCAGREAIALSEGMTLESFSSDRMAQHAMVRLIQTVGEAARQVSETGRARLPQVPWREIVGMRHRLVHDYTHIDVRTVFAVLRNDLPALVASLEPLVPTDDERPQ